MHVYGWICGPYIPPRHGRGGASLINTEAERWDGVGWIEYCSLAAGLGGISSEWDEDGDDGGGDTN